MENEIANLNLILNLASIIAGIAGIAIASTWRRELSRWVFVLLVICVFIAPACLSLCIQWLNATSGFAGPATPAIQFITYAYQTFGYLSMILLVFYAVLARDDTIVKVSVPTVVPIGPSWNTDLDAKQRTLISSKRNLAFAVDYAPMLLAIVAYIYWLGYVRLNHHYELGPLVDAYLPLGFSLLAALAPLYIVFKDSFGGQSIGKRLFDCRVVDEQTGQPISVGHSIIRNLIFLVPFGAGVELVASMARKDKRRFGDLISETQVVAGPPQFVDGILVANKVEEETGKHPLDD